MQLYHNPRCRKSRETLALLEEKGYQPTIIKYLESPPSVEELKKILTLLDLTPLQLIRKGESLYKENYKNRTFTTEEWLTILVENPKLIERPIFIHNGQARIGRPPETVLEIL